MGLPPSTICHANEGGFFLPLFSNQFEERWPVWLRALLYLLGLLYSFIGVGEISDVFMEAIEVITSTERDAVGYDERGRQVATKVKVWNSTVSSLTLMALGSSAPEILLNIVEVVGNGFFAGNLGPSTIVGSASFNFLIIIAVCILAVPDGEQRRIRSLATFIVTTVFSLFAYGWMYIAISVWTPDVITIAEATITALCLPVLVVLAYTADTGAFGGNDVTFAQDSSGGPPMGAGVVSMKGVDLRNKRASVRRSFHELTFDERFEVDRLTAQMRKVRQTEDPRGEYMTNQQVADIAAVDIGLVQPHSIAYYRSLSARSVLSFIQPQPPLPPAPPPKALPPPKIKPKRVRFGGWSKNHKGKPFFEAIVDSPLSLPALHEWGDSLHDPALLEADVELSDKDDFAMIAVEMMDDEGGDDEGGLFGKYSERVRNSLQLMPSGTEGGNDGAEGGEAPVRPSAGDVFVHVISVPWKVAAATLVPPPDLWGGGPAFGFSLALIGLTTAFVADLAGILGCVVGISDPITAITLVALGTSLPDTFASRIAAVNEPTADNSITNVTGSNSVNVFVGLGLPWLFASIYWATTGPTEEWLARYPQVVARFPAGQAGYVLVGGDLGFTVAGFVIVCLLGVCLLVYRRFALGAELGGGRSAKRASAAVLVGLWLTYTTSVCLKFADKF
ncbi:Sodium/calcium exchanger protein-domain-containing protein [Pavlovales sp. CCMP2436]|nr:Sodium/calcium exchanger protein-domain-containing protein [Pavlovales sp. CCMP2436]